MLTTGARRWTGEVLLVVVVVAIDLLVYDGNRATRSGGALPRAVVPVLVVAVHTTLLLRWRRPGPVLLVQCILAALVGLVLPDVQLFMGVLVALHAVARTSSRRPSVAALCGFAPVLLLHAVNGTRSTPPADRTLTLVYSLVLWAMIALAVWRFGRVALVAQQRAERARELRALEVVREERLRLARELHDVISAGVGAMLLQAAGARGFIDGADPRVVGALEVIEGAGAATMDELHQLLGLLRTSDDVPGAAPDAPAPSLADVPHLVARAREGGLDVHLHAHGDPAPVDPGVDLAGYRLVQEALTNATKHAGAGASVIVGLTWGEHLEVSVRDAGGSGGGAQVAPWMSSGHGLAGLAERVALVGGHLEATSTPDGYLVRAELPVRAGGPARDAALDQRAAA